MKHYTKKILLFSVSLFFLVSCDIKEKGIETNNSGITVESKYGTHVISNYEIPFTAKDRSGNDITDNVTFYVDETAQTNNQISFSATGIHNVKAKITIDGELLESNELSVAVTNPRHSTKILVEDFTGTWCVNCPRVAFHLEEAVQQNNKIIPMAVHNRGFETDPFHFSDFGVFRTNYGINSFPTALCNRNFNWNDNSGTAQLSAELAKSQALGLSVNSSVNGNNINIEVKTRFDLDLKDLDLFLVVCITENGLIADQANATSFYGGQNPIPNFVHNHTLRVALTGVNGTPIPHDQTDISHEFVYNFSGAIPSEIADINNCEIVAFVGEDAETSPAKIKVINIQKANVGVFQDFD